MIRNNWTNFAQCCLARKKDDQIKIFTRPLNLCSKWHPHTERKERWDEIATSDYICCFEENTILVVIVVHTDKLCSIPNFYTKPIFIPWHNLAIIQFYGRRFYLIFWGLLWDTYQNNEGKRTKTGENGVIRAKKCRQISKWLRDIKFEGWLWDANSN